jgi:hypothetical protein
VERSGMAWVSKNFSIQQALSNPVTVNPDRKMKNAVHSCVHTLKKRMAFRKADESLSVQTKLASFFTPALLGPKKVQLLSLLLMNKYVIFL